MKQTPQRPLTLDKKDNYFSRPLNLICLKYSPSASMLQIKTRFSIKLSGDLKTQTLFHYLQPHRLDMDYCFKLSINKFILFNFIVNTFPKLYKNYLIKEKIYYKIYFKKKYKIFFVLNIFYIS